MPLTHEINITFDTRALQTIYAAGQSVTIVSGVSSYVASPLLDAKPQPQAAWLVFRPTQVNRIRWSDTPSLYATVTPAFPPNVIMINSITTAPVTLGQIYPFAQGHFGHNFVPGPGTSYNMRNDMGGYDLYFGLHQAAELNGRPAAGPLNAVRVLQGQEADFTLLNQISIFLSSASQDGAVIPGVPASALTFKVTGDLVNVAFNDAMNTFYIVSSSATAVNQ